MVYKPERDNQYTARFTDFIHREYGIAAHSVTPARRGYYGETWRVAGDCGSYFIKIVYTEAHKPLYERSLPVTEHMNRHGIDFISKIVKTVSGSLCTHFNGATVGVFDWIGGENIQDQRTKIAEYNMLAKIYVVPTEGLVIPHETFGTESAEVFCEQWRGLKRSPKCEASEKILRVFEENEITLKRLSDRLTLFSERCKTDLSYMYITHGDAGGNIIVNGDRFYIVDWDDPVIAPPERDAWFCLHWDWAMKGFGDALRENQVDYTLRPERLAYYCYYIFFWYLTKYMETYFEYGDESGELTGEIADYFMSCWINDNIKYADALI